MELSREEMARLIALEDPDECAELYRRAYAVKERFVGRKVSLRGLVECGNACRNDCFYCGIRKSNVNCSRYRMSVDEVVSCAEFAAEAGYGSLALQSGEIRSEENTAFFEEVLQKIAPLNLGVTLSLGEQDFDAYRRWKEAGAARYLLRMETSNPRLFASIHPAECSFENRRRCLMELKELGYQLGTGVMIGFPGQTAVDLADDIGFFAEIDADMIGMGPWIPHSDTPMNRADASTEKRFRMGLNMIAVTRLRLENINIAATTALQAMKHKGRESGLMAGANVIMPNVTPPKRKENYLLYNGKPGLDENSEFARKALTESVAEIGETINWNRRGDSPHFTGACPASDECRHYAP